MIRMIRRIASLTALAALTLGPLPPAGALTFACADPFDDAVHEFPGNQRGITGRFALPAEAPTHLVAYAHGYSHDTTSWIEHLRRTADQGAAAFATDYRGAWTDADGHKRGWWVAEGAEDTIDVAKTFLALCPSIETVILHGVSMGGNTAGLALAAGPTKADGEPLFDWAVLGEPAANVIETYLEATFVAPTNAFATRAKADIEAEHGGTLAERPFSYANGTVVLRAGDIAAGGVRGVAIVHAFDDGTVPYDQGRELATVLRAAGVPTDMYSVARRGEGEDAGENSTISEIFLGPTGQWNEPLAGHGTESSQTQIVIQTGLDIVFALIAGDADATPAGSEYLVDGELGVMRLT